MSIFEYLNKKTYIQIIEENKKNCNEVDIYIFEQKKVNMPKTVFRSKKSLCVDDRGDSIPGISTVFQANLDDGGQAGNAAWIGDLISAHLVMGGITLLGGVRWALDKLSCLQCTLDHLGQGRRRGGVPGRG